jgi:predicted PurR-regulated permease PerM
MNAKVAPSTKSAPTKVAPSTARDAGVPRHQPVTAGKVLVWGGIGLLLYVAHVAFIPIALALLFALLLSGPVEALHTKRVPRSVSAALILIIALTAIGGVVGAAWNPAQEWFSKAPETLNTIKQKVSPVAKFMSRLDDLRKLAGNMGSKGRAGAAAASAPAPAGESAPMLIVDTGGAAAAGILSFVIVTLFLLTGGPPMMARMVAAFAGNVNSSYVHNIIERVREEVGYYYRTTTLINLCLGLATGVAMWAWGMPTPYLWGAMAAVLNYIPYAGPGTTLLVITGVALVSFDTLGHVFGVAGSYVLIALIEGQVAQPLFVGRRMEVNPLLIFLALWFGGLFWGIAGIVLATPTLVALKVIAENTNSGKPMMEFLGPNDQTPDRDARLMKLATLRR